MITEPTVDKNGTTASQAKKAETAAAKSTSSSNTASSGGYSYAGTGSGASGLTDTGASVNPYAEQAIQNFMGYDGSGGIIGEFSPIGADFVNVQNIGTPNYNRENLGFSHFLNMPDNNNPFNNAMRSWMQSGHYQAEGQLMSDDDALKLALDNLKKLLEAKGTLIQKALGADRLTVETSEDRVSFPWWDHLPGNDEMQAYMAFIAALCAMAKEAKRVTAKEPDAESEKYAFRCFLLRLGFIGADSKAQRKLLLQKLSGSSAFRSAEEARKFSEAQKAKRDAAKATAAETDGTAETEEVAVCE